MFVVDCWHCFVSCLHLWHFLTLDFDNLGAHLHCFVDTVTACWHLFCWHCYCLLTFVLLTLLQYCLLRFVLLTLLLPVDTVGVRWHFISCCWHCFFPVFQLTSVFRCLVRARGRSSSRVPSSSPWRLVTTLLWLTFFKLICRMSYRKSPSHMRHVVGNCKVM